MANAERIQNPVQWYEGMLLLPEHFQQTDRRLEQLINYHVSNAKGFSWGVRKLQIDPGRLITGTFKVIEIEAVFPDGLVAHCTPDDTLDLSCDLKAFSETLATKPLYVFLVVPEYRMGANNTEGDMARYRSQLSNTLTDDNTGRGEISVPTLVPNISLKVLDGPPNHYSSIPIAEITLVENTYLMTNYIPPMVNTPLDSDLGKICEDLTKRLRSKIGFVAERIRSRSLGVLSTEAETVMRCLNTGILPFEAYLNTNNANPFDLYVVLCQLTSQLVNLSPGQMPPTFNAYNHLNIRASFNEVLDFISTMLDRIQEGYSVMPFTQKDRLFMLKLDQTWLSNRLILGAKFPPTATEKEMVDWVNTAVIATDHFVEGVRDRRVLGAARKVITGDDEMKLMPAKDVILFEVQNDPSVIDPSENLLVFNVGDSLEKRPGEIVMFIPKHREDSFF